MSLTPSGVRDAVRRHIRPMLALAPILAVAACDRPEAARDPAAERPALTVRVEPVVSRVLPRTIAATGTVVAWRELLVGSESAGLAVVHLAAEEGDVVEKGDLLLRLNDDVLQAQIRQQQAAVQEAQVALESARSAQSRAQKLIITNAISRESAEERDTTARTAEAKLMAAEAALAQLEAQAARARILAPAGGIVSKRSATLGQVVQAGTELFRIIQDGRLEVNASVPEAELLKIRPGMKARVADPSGQTIEASVRAVAPVVDASSRLGTVHVALPAGTALKPGMFARVAIAPEEMPTLTVPREALVWRAGTPGVFVVDEKNMTSLRAVSTGRQSDERIEIHAGLKEGERVVAVGAGFLNDGDRVFVQSAAAGEERAKR